jgi:hypothetical protein
MIRGVLASPDLMVMPGTARQGRMTSGEAILATVIQPWAIPGQVNAGRTARDQMAPTWTTSGGTTARLEAAGPRVAGRAVHAHLIRALRTRALGTRARKTRDCSNLARRVHRASMLVHMTRARMIRAPAARQSVGPDHAIAGKANPGRFIRSSSVPILGTRSRGAETSGAKATREMSQG